MPVMDGYEASQEIKKLMKDEVVPAVDIIAISSFTDEKHIQ
jgi:CheY-like chemotaxis protein